MVHRMQKNSKLINMRKTLEITRNQEISLFYRYYFGRCSSELAQLVPLPFSQGRFTCYPDRLHDFSVTSPRFYKDVYGNSFFPCIDRLGNSLPIECFQEFSAYRLLSLDL